VRWQKIIYNAAQQCEVRWIPKLYPPEKFDNVIPHLKKYDLALIGSLYEGARPFREVPMPGRKSSAVGKGGILSSAQSSIPGKTKVSLLIGPEGDFSRDEVQRAVDAGAVPVSFGGRILRTETAAIFGLSVLAYELL